MSEEEFEAYRRRVFGESSGKQEETDKAIDQSPHGFSLFSVSLDKKGILCVASRRRTPDGALSCGGHSVRPDEPGYDASVKFYEHLGLTRGKHYVKQERWENGEWVVEVEGVSDSDS